MTEILGFAVETMTLEERCARLAELAQEAANLLRHVEGACMFEVHIYPARHSCSVMMERRAGLEPMGEIASDTPFRHRDGIWTQGFWVTVGEVKFWTRDHVPAPVREEATA